MNNIKLNPSTNVGLRQVLPTSVMPSHYSLEFAPDLEKSVFDGNAIIKISFKENSNKIVLNSNEIDIYNVTLKLSTYETTYLQLKDVSYDTDLTQATIPLPVSIPSGSEGELVMRFRGKLNDQFDGFYRSSHKGEDGKELLFASTYFEASNARKAFPCWDEPEYKATFDISLKVPKDLTALSNMDILKEESINNSLKLVKYATTPKMSTYLIAFAIGELDYVEKYSLNNIRCRIYAPKGLSEQGNFALDVATKVLDFYEKLFDISYPLSKLDSIAIPGFKGGAMENWGLVTYRLELLLLDDLKSIKSRQLTAILIAHEYAHQWFGNLVTMKWWSDVWLKEGFATWIPSYALDKIFPEWDMWTKLLAGGFNDALLMDSRRISHPVESVVNNPAEYSQFFDDISYKKAASVINMLYLHLGDEVFFNGIRTYLKNYSYKNVETNDLWNAISSVSKQNISNIMAPWTKQVGFPYLKVEDIGEKISITQNRFLLSGDATKDENESLWWIPLGFVSGNSTVELTLTDRTMKIDKPQSLFKLNKNHVGPYRVQYPKKAIESMGPLLSNPDIFTTRERFGIISDLAALAQSGIGNATDFLDSLRFYKDEKNYHVLNEISSHLTSMQSVWFEESKYVTDELDAAQRNIFTPVVKNLSWEAKPDEATYDTLLRTLAIANAGKNGDLEVINESQLRFNSYTSGNKSAIHPELLAPVFSIVSLYSNSESFSLMKKECFSANSVELRRTLFQALGLVSSPDLISKALNLTLGNQISPLDGFNLFVGLGNNPKSRRTTCEFILAHWDTLEASYPGLFSYIIESTISKLSSQKDVQTIQNFDSSKESGINREALLAALKSIELNAAWLNRARGPVQSWLKVPKI